MARDTLLVDSGNVDAALAGAATVVRATYLHPYQMHGSVGSSCAVADVQAGRATIWSATQAAYPLRDTTAALLGFQPAQVRVVFTRGSGCYGLNGADTVSFDAALLSQAVGRPVRVQLSRQDEMAWENFGMAFVIDQRAGVDANGNLVAWDYEAWSPALGGRPGYERPGNVVTGALVGAQPVAVAPRSPAPQPAGAPQQRLEHRTLLRRWLRRGRVPRHRHAADRAGAVAPGPVAVLHGSTPRAGAFAEHVRPRMLHGRSGGQGRRRSGGVPPPAPA